MLRRAFMRLLGLAPVAAVAAPALLEAAKQEPLTFCYDIPPCTLTITSMHVYDGNWNEVPFTVTSTAGGNVSSISIDMVSDQATGSAYYSYKVT